jgi:glucokinase
MSVVIGADLGGTKLSVAVCNADGAILHQHTHALDGREGEEAGAFVTRAIASEVEACAAIDQPVMSVGLCVPGIARPAGTVWAPNIEGWTDYPLRDEVSSAVGGLPVALASDRTGYILGETWKGHAQGVDHAVYLAVGTGIGAGILVDGQILEGSQGIAGAIGWMVLNAVKDDAGRALGSFETQASGEGMVRQARRLLSERPGYSGVLLRESGRALSTSDLFEAFDKDDPVAVEVIGGCIRLWGMAVANLVSLFNPQVVVLGGGVFGPAARFLPEIRKEAEGWAQPVAFRQTRIEVSALGGDAGLYGACRLAWDALYVND